MSPRLLLKLTTIKCHVAKYSAQQKGMHIHIFSTRNLEIFKLKRQINTKTSCEPLKYTSSKSIIVHSEQKLQLNTYCIEKLILEDKEQDREDKPTKQPTPLLASHLWPIVSLCFTSALSTESCEVNCTNASPVVRPRWSVKIVIPLGTISNPVNPTQKQTLVSKEQAGFSSKLYITPYILAM